MGKTSELFLDIREKIKEQVNAVIEGEVNPFEVGREISLTKKAIEDAKYQIDEVEKNEFDKYTKQELIEMKIQLSGGGYTWKFDHIPEWTELNKKLKEIEDRAKSAFRMAEKSQTLYDNETGAEIIPANGIGRKQSVIYK